MCPTVTVVAAVFIKYPAQVSLIEHDNVIQTVPANGTDHAFDEWILPRRSARCCHLFDTKALDPSSHSVTIDASAVTQQITRCGIKWKRLQELLVQCQFSRANRRCDWNRARNVFSTASDRFSMQMMLQQPPRNSKDFSPIPFSEGTGKQSVTSL